MLRITRKTSLLFTALCVAVMSDVGQAVAQSVVRVNDGTGTQVNQSGQTFDISGGTQAGANLFQSFQKFGLSQGETANFIANPSIQNILGRVVGGDASVINGLIKVTSTANPNLYLMNPAGIIFGVNASLNVPGAFTATTANGIGFGSNWFNAVGTNNYAALVEEPSRFAFTMPQPGAIVNAGELAVGAGQNLVLLGGTVLSTGTLSAPGGNITVASVPGEKLVRISQTGSVLSFDLPVAPTTTANPLPVIPLSLPQLLTGGNATGATNVALNSDGTVSLTGTGLTADSGDVVAKTVTAQSATLAANQNLLLSESQLRTTGDLALLAKNVVVRDSVTAPAVIQAGGNLNIRGDQGIDILTLNHPESSVQSGGNLSLVSNGVISGDAHFTSGSNFLILNLAGNPGNFSSLYDPIISSSGDVVFGDYTGASLKVEAKGSITGGNIIITGPDTSSSLFPGWEVAGDVRFETSKFGSGSTVSPSQALITNRTSVPQAALETFLDLPNGGLNNFGNGKPINGSAIKTTFTAQAGDVVSFNWRFLTNEPISSSTDFAFVQLITPAALANTRFPDGTGSGFVQGPKTNFSSTVKFRQGTPIQTYVATIPVAGTYTLGVGVGSTSASTNSSGVIVDNVSSRPLMISDQSLLAAGPALILRAGVVELQNLPNLPQLNVPTVTTNFIEPESSTLGNITVGNIIVGNSDPINISAVSIDRAYARPAILSATGSVTAGITTSSTQGFIYAGSLDISSGSDIRTGSIRTTALNGNQQSDATGSVTLSSTAGRVVVDTIRAINNSSFASNITIKAYDVFQARTTFSIGSAGATGLGSSGLSTAPASIVASGKISIQHGGVTFAAGLGVERDANGVIVFRALSGARNGERVLIRPGNDRIEFIDPSNPGNTMAISASVRAVPFRPEDVPSDTSYTAGVILIGDGFDSTLRGSFQDTVLDRSSDIQITAIPRIRSSPTDLGSSGSSSKPDAPIDIQKAQTVQRQLTKQITGTACNGSSSSVTALTTTELGTSARSGSIASSPAPASTNPCSTANDDVQILQILEK